MASVVLWSHEQSGMTVIWHKGQKGFWLERHIVGPGNISEPFISERNPKLPLKMADSEKAIVRARTLASTFANAPIHQIIAEEWNNPLDLMREV